MFKKKQNPITEMLMKLQTASINEYNETMKELNQFKKENPQFNEDKHLDKIHLHFMAGLVFFTTATAGMTHLSHILDDPENPLTFKYMKASTTAILNAMDKTKLIREYSAAVGRDWNEILRKGGARCPVCKKAFDLSQTRLIQFDNVLKIFCDDPECFKVKLLEVYELVKKSEGKA